MVPLLVECVFKSKENFWYKNCFSRNRHHSVFKLYYNNYKDSTELLNELLPTVSIVNRLNIFK